MKLIYTHENITLVGTAQNLLTQANIISTIKNQYSSGGVGELGAFQSWPELWIVNDHDFERASAIIKKLHVPPQGDCWRCQHCGESNEASFEVCWQCHTEKPE